MLLDLDPHLTRDPLTANASITHAGMAHFAATGPQGKTCRECKLWQLLKGIFAAYYSSKGKTLKPHPCQKFQQLTGKRGPCVPHNSCACKYFEQRESPPAIFDPRRGAT
jgi:hypothetical protein